LAVFFETKEGRPLIALLEKKAKDLFMGSSIIGILISGL